MRNDPPYDRDDSDRVEGEGLAIVAILIGLLLVAAGLARFHSGFNAVVEALTAQPALESWQTLVLGAGLLVGGAWYFIRSAILPTDRER